VERLPACRPEDGRCVRARGANEQRGAIAYANVEMFRVRNCSEKDDRFLAC
jgi:hypothetical protein